MIRLSRAAVSEVNRLKSNYLSQTAHFRMKVEPGGCSNFCYTLQFDEVVRSEDQCLNCDGVEVIVDAKSLRYINGLTIDYSEDLMGGGFRFHNPNATHHCDCGNSFAIAE